MTKVAMKKFQNICFFCLTSKSEDFCGEAEDGSDNNKTGGSSTWGSVNILLKYLLDTRDQQYQCLLQNIRQVLDSAPITSNTEDCFQLCSKCHFNAKQIADAHKQLEVLQMKIIHDLKSARGTITQYFEGDTCDSERLRQKLEVVLKKRRKSNQPNRKKILETVSQFQLAVHEKGKLAIEVPFVFLDKYSYTSKEEYSSNFIVKTEAEDIDLDYKITAYLEQYDEHEDTLSYDEDGDNNTLPLPTVDSFVVSDLPSVPKWKRKADKGVVRERKAAKKAPSQLKEEIDLNFPNSSIRVGKRACRSRAELSSAEKETKKNGPSDNNKVRTKTLKTREKKISLKRKKKIKMTAKDQQKIRDQQKIKDRARSKFQCDLCPYKSKFTYLFESHLRSHDETTSAEVKDGSTPTTFTCDKCSKSFSSKQYFTFHVNGHKGRKRIMCDFCKLKVPYSDIAEHLKSHNVEKIFYCPNCSFCSSTRDQYLIHLRFHGKGRLDCDLCNKFFRTKGKLLEHLYLEHKTVDKYVCEMEGCNKEFYDIAHLRLHMNIHKNPVECPDCGRIFMNATVLKVHQRSHTGEMLFPCSDCSDSFASKTSLQYHLINFHGAAKFKCEYCNKEYTSESALRTHRTIHEGTGIPCGKCDKVMGNKALWRRHQIVHTTEQNFICEDCGKGFTSKQGLKKHAPIHGGEKKFKCQFCDKVFLFRKYLSDHERTHTGERPYTCNLCGKGFTQGASLYVHTKKHHPTIQQERADQSSVIKSDLEASFSPDY